jgi:hypothetical protein
LNQAQHVALIFMRKLRCLVLVIGQFHLRIGLITRPVWRCSSLIFHIVLQLCVRIEIPVSRSCWCDLSVDWCGIAICICPTQLPSQYRVPGSRAKLYN